MPLFLVRREVPSVQEEDLRSAILRAVSCAFNFDGMRWVTTYLDHEHERAYCVYEARDAEELRDHAERARIPCDEITSIFAISPENLLTTGETVNATP